MAFGPYLAAAGWLMLFAGPELVGRLPLAVWPALSAPGVPAPANRA